MRIMRSERASSSPSRLAEGATRATTRSSCCRAHRGREGRGVDRPACREGRRHRQGRRRAKTLTYDITERADQTITFFDIDHSGAGTEIKTINGGGRGSFTFKSKPGKEIRRIEARLEIDGVPAETLPIARYRPPSPVLPKPAGLKVRRSGTKLIVSWKRVTDAKGYDIVALAVRRRRPEVRDHEEE